MWRRGENLENTIQEKKLIKDNENEKDKDTTDN